MKAIDILKYTTKEELSRYKHLTACREFASELLDTIDISLDIKEKILNTILLHDIGYSEVISNTGYHSLDGYHYLKNNYPNVCYYNAILLHSDFVNTCPAEYTDFVIDIYNSLSDLEFAILIFLDYCDSHIDGTGNEVTLEGRWIDLHNRYNDKPEKLQELKDILSYASHVEKIVDRMLDLMPKFVSEVETEKDF